MYLFYYIDLLCTLIMLSFSAACRRGSKSECVGGLQDIPYMHCLTSTPTHPTIESREDTTIEHNPTPLPGHSTLTQMQATTAECTTIFIYQDT